MEKFKCMCLFLLAGLFCCKSPLPKKTYGGGKDCSVYYEYVQRSWKKNTDGYFKLTEKPEYDEDLWPFRRLAHEECLLGLNKKQALRIFGEPTVKQEKRFDYYMNEKCERPDTNGCLRLKIFFNNEGLVSKVPLIMKETPPLK